MVDSTVEAGKEKRSLEYLVATENKEADKKTKGWGMSKQHRSQRERGPIGQSWNYLSTKINNPVLDCNPKL